MEKRNYWIFSEPSASTFSLNLVFLPSFDRRWLQMTREKIDVEYGLNGFQPMHPPFLIFWEVEALRVKFRGLSSTYVTPLIEGQPQDR